MDYVVPSKRIVSKEDLDEFLASDAYKEYVGYIERLNNSVKNLKNDAEVEISKVPSKKKAAVGQHYANHRDLECANYSRHFRHIVTLGKRDSSC